jgi:CheY-like chemotaxis protein
MNAVIGFAQMLEFDSSLNADQQDNVHEILKGGRHLLELINEVLDLAKVESGNLVLSLESVDISCVVEECLTMIEPLVAARQITMHLDSPPQMAVCADRVRFKQALLNILSNAVKYNRKGGDIWLKVQSGVNERHRISVTDTGNGIAPERIVELFQPFNRLGAEHGEIEGTGIGLIITRRLVELMGGEVGVDSQVDVGTTFWIELPNDATVRLNSLAEVDFTSAKTDTLTKQYRVLCIDDNPANLKLITQMLGIRKNIDLVTARTPELGIGLALTYWAELILLDINMPGMDGFQVLDIFKADAHLRTIPVIAITANAMPRDVERGLAAGFAEYLTKPLDLGEFLKTIDRYLIGSEENTL